MARLVIRRLDPRYHTKEAGAGCKDMHNNQSSVQMCLL